VVFDFAMLYLGNGARYSLGDNYSMIESYRCAFDCYKKVDDLGCQFSTLSSIILVRLDSRDFLYKVALLPQISAY